MKKVQVLGKGINNFSGQGKIVHVTSFKDFQLVKNGEVVVTKNATPDFILILKRVACLITDKGSVTSHIAIICREFQIPAIVGTGNASRVLTPGSIVNFNTKKGFANIVFNNK